MTESKLNVFFSFYPYGGNGGTASEVPTVRNWFAKTAIHCKQDQRIGEIKHADWSDTPITMTRNAAVLEARRQGADVLVMVDSDMAPDAYLERDGAKTFFPSSFDFLWERKRQGLPTVVAAPYCGPPPHENVYLFRWAAPESDAPDPNFKLAQYGREEAAILRGIHPAAALPTGLIMFDMGVLEYTDPKHEYADLLAQGKSKREAAALTRSWFYYEYDDIYQAAKASTEDVTATRDLGLICQWRTGHHPLFCNWDAWAGHYKPKLVGPPAIVGADQVNAKYSAAVRSGTTTETRRIFMRNGHTEQDQGVWREGLALLRAQ